MLSIKQHLPRMARLREHIAAIHEFIYAFNMEVRSRIEGEFNGYDGDTVFRLLNGQLWRQAYYRYHYRYAYMPEVRIYRDGGKYMMEVSVMDEPIEVVRVE